MTLLVLAYALICAFFFILVFYFGRLYGLIIFYGCSILLAEMLFSVQVELFGVHLVLGSVHFCFIPVIIDIINELYGYKCAKRVIALGMMTVAFYIVLCLMNHYAFSTGNDLYFSKQLRIAIVDLIVSYGLVQLLNSLLFDKIKTLTNKKYLWIRTFLSTAFTQLLIAVLFYEGVFFEELPQRSIFELISGGLILKVVFAGLEIPIIYLLKALAQKKNIVDANNND